MVGSKINQQSRFLSIYHDTVVDTTILLIRISTVLADLRIIADSFSHECARQRSREGTNENHTIIRNTFIHAAINHSHTW